jgi:PPOX class probable F420-dependent enzyme
VETRDPVVVLTDRPVLTDPLARAFLATARTATLATIRPDGRPRLVPICFVLGGDDAAGRPRLYSPVDEKPKRTDDPADLARIRDIRGRPDVALLIDRWDEDWARLGWLRCDATAALLDPDTSDIVAVERATAIDALRGKYPQYADHRLEERPIIRLTVTSSSSWGALG